jgi:hypothetical protein
VTESRNGVTVLHLDRPEGLVPTGWVDMECIECLERGGSMQEVGNIGHTESFNVHHQFRFLFYTMNKSKIWDVTSTHTSKNVARFS